jgi:3-methyl-2-oxobutanoate hydroxymethyltransferase
VKRAPVIVDLPAESYDTPDLALHNAKRLVEAGADAVKLEGGVAVIESVRAIIDAGMGYVGHIGMLPQSVKVEGGYKKKGRTEEGADALVKDAVALDEAGAAAIVLESVVPEVAKRITAAVKIPTIGIGSGDGCDAQVLVSHDLLGLFPWFKPPFATAEADLAGEISKAARAFITKVKGPAR